MKNLSLNLFSLIGWISFVGLIITFGFVFSIKTYKLSILVLHINTFLVLSLYIFEIVKKLITKDKIINNSCEIISSLGMCFAIIVPFVLIALEVFAIQLTLL